MVENLVLGPILVQTRFPNFLLWVLHGGSPTNFRGGDLKISDQNNGGGPEQKIKFGAKLNLRGDQSVKVIPKFLIQLKVIASNWCVRGVINEIASKQCVRG